MTNIRLYAPFMEIDEVRQVLLDRIAEAAKEQTHSPALRDLAEAWAWLAGTKEERQRSGTAGF